MINVELSSIFLHGLHQYHASEEPEINPTKVEADGGFVVS
jgi:hypothetical protein